MNNILTKVLTSLIVALITGLTFLAFSKPETYKIIALWIALIATICMLGFFLFSLGKESSRNPTSESKNTPMSIAINMLGIWFIFLVFLAILYFLTPVIVR